jgi:hypothetical protein
MTVLEKDAHARNLPSPYECQIRQLCVIGSQHKDCTVVPLRSLTADKS